MKIVEATDLIPRPEKSCERCEKALLYVGIATRCWATPKIIRQFSIGPEGI